MPRPTKTEAQKKREEKRTLKCPALVAEYIIKNKYLRLPIHHKNNFWSWAAWDSWAAQGKDGGCRICGVDYYNATLKNKRTKTERGKQTIKDHRWALDVSSKICSHCVTEIHKQLGVEFTKQ